MHNILTAMWQVRAYNTRLIPLTTRPWVEPCPRQRTPDPPREHHHCSPTAGTNNCLWWNKHWVKYWAKGNHLGPICDRFRAGRGCGGLRSRPFRGQETWGVWGLGDSRICAMRKRRIRALIWEVRNKGRSRKMILVEVRNPCFWEAWNPSIRKVRNPCFWAQSFGRSGIQAYGGSGHWENGRSRI